MSLPGRISVLLLALVPAAWGLCPCWLAESVASPAAAKKIAASPPACCPRCRQTHQLSDATGRPPTPPKPCEGCALMDAGHGTLPAQAVPALPDAALAGVVALVPRAAPPAFAPQGVPVMDTGPPAVRLDCIVLLI